MTFDEIARMTLTEYEKKWLAQQYKYTQNKDDFRQLETTIINFGGMGSTEPLSPSKWKYLGLIDTDEVILPIRSDKEAMEVFKEVIES